MKQQGKLIGSDSCDGCKYFESSYDRDTGIAGRFCHHPRTGGESRTLYMRGDENACGTKGKLFEPIDPPKDCRDCKSFDRGICTHPNFRQGGKNAPIATWARVRDCGPEGSLFEPIDPPKAERKPLGDCFSEYDREAAKTAIYPHSEAKYDPDPLCFTATKERSDALTLAVLYCSLGLGEAGEIQGKAKKILRDSNGILTIETRDQMLAEMGDVLWYLSRLAYHLDSSLLEVALRNLAKLQKRQVEGTLKGSGDDR